MVRKILGLMLFLCVFIGSGFGADAATETFDQRYDVHSTMSLDVLNKNGSITIETWDEAQVRVVAVKKTRFGGRLKNVDIEVTIGETLSVRTIALVKSPRVSVSYSIHVPKGFIVSSVTTSNGSIVLDGTQGRSVLKTSNGGIDVNDVKGDVHADTSNGKIEIKDVDGTIEAETSNGRITIENVGAIALVKTSNGSIKAEIPVVHAEPVTLKTSNGSIDVWIATTVNADLALKTSNGKITLHDFEIVASEISKTEVKGKIGDGGVLLTLKTSNGSIDVHSLD